MMLLDKLLDLAMLPPERMGENARRMARFSLYDWMVCAIAGYDEPVARIVRDLVSREGGVGEASLAGGGMVPARAAALANGATSHALDYDDTHFAHVGHPSVAIYPAALAAAERTGRPAGEVVEAFLAGAELSIRIGLLLGPAHYNRGFHQTATAGAFGATAAAGRLFALDRGQMRMSLNLCATRASGLKSQFGTMGKPYNAGIAAANGVECALLAKAGFTSAGDGILGDQGFVATHSDAPDAASAFASAPPGAFLFEDISYKFHACCHGTHAMIEALSALRRTAAIGPSDVEVIELETAPRWLTVCDIKAPRGGLEVKFSYAWLAAMVFHDRDTASRSGYSDALATDAALGKFASRVRVTGNATMKDTEARGVIQLNDGRILPFAHDIATRLPPATLEAALRAKATALIGARAEELWILVSNLERHGAVDLGATLRKHGR